MNPSRLFLLLAAAASSVALMLAGCSKSDTASTPVDQVKAGAADVAATASDSWDSVKDYTYDKRVEFTASIGRMTARFDDKSREWKDKASDSTSATTFANECDPNRVSYPTHTPAFASSCSIT